MIVNSKIFVSENCPARKHHRRGFKLYEVYKDTKYELAYDHLSLEDCQELCEITEGCFYFTFWETRNYCWLKWGMGAKTNKKYLDFGPKNCPGKYQ